MNPVFEMLRMFNDNAFIDFVIFSILLIDANVQLNFEVLVLCYFSMIVLQ